MYLLSATKLTGIIPTAKSTHIIIILLVLRDICSHFHRKILDDLSSADAALHKNSSSDPLSAAAAATLQAHHIQVCMRIGESL